MHLGNPKHLSRLGSLLVVLSSGGVVGGWAALIVCPPSPSPPISQGHSSLPQSEVKQDIELEEPVKWANWRNRGRPCCPEKMEKEAEASGREKPAPSFMGCPC